MIAISLTLLSFIAAIVVYRRFCFKTLTPPKPRPAAFRLFTPTTLLDFNGVGDKPVYLAVCGRVFDVTGGKHFYGPVNFRFLTQSTVD